MSKIFIQGEILEGVKSSPLLRLWIKYLLRGSSSRGKSRRRRRGGGGGGVHKKRGSSKKIIFTAPTLTKSFFF